MAHFAKVVNGVVVKQIVAEPEFFNTFVDSTPGRWIQASYNTKGGVHYNPETGEPSADQSKALRKNYPGNGFSYNAELNAFIPPKPYESWVLNETTCLWDPPVAYPTDNNYYNWNESAQQWEQTEVTR